MAWLPVQYTEPFEGRCWWQHYWEGTKTVFSHTGSEVTKEVVTCIYPAYKYVKSHHNPNTHTKTLVLDPDKHFVGSRIADQELFDLNRKEW